MSFTLRQKAAAKAIVAVFETGKPMGNYSAFAVLRDGAGISYGSHQATHGGGTLYKIVKRYTEISDDAEAIALKEYLPILSKTGKNAASVIKASKDSNLKKLLVAAGRRPKMKFAQDEVFDKNYLEPAETFCRQNGFKTALTLAVVFDSLVQGSFRMIAKSVTANSEKEWAKTYCAKRLYWLSTTRVNTVLKNTVYRPKAFQALMTQGNWECETPFFVRGVKITDDVINSHIALLDPDSDDSSELVVEAPEVEEIVEESPANNEVAPPLETEDGAKVGESVPDEPAQEGEAVVGGRPSDPPTIITPASATKPEGPKAWLATIQGWWVALGLSGVSFGSVLSGAATSAQTIKFLLVLGAAGLAFAGIAWIIYMVVRAVHVRNREREAHEINKLELSLKADPAKYNVKLDRRILPRDAEGDTIVEPTESKGSWFYKEPK